MTKRHADTNSIHKEHWHFISISIFTPAKLLNGSLQHLGKKKRRFLALRSWNKNAKAV